MKKLVALMLCGAMAIGALAGCGGKKADTPETSVQEEKIEYAEIQWPTMGLAQMLPTPKSNIGYIRYDNSELVSIDIANTTQEDFNEYANACAEKGFVEDYTKSDTTYLADGNGCYIHLGYDPDNCVMTVHIERNEDSDLTDTDSTNTNSTDANQTQQQEQNDTSENPQTQTSSDGIRPEVKEFLDSYESFMNEYAAFMKKYQNSNDTVSMMKDYADYMAKYADFTQKYNALDQSDFNDAETAYYIDVQARVTKVLADVAQ